MCYRQMKFLRQTSLGQNAAGGVDVFVRASPPSGVYFSLSDSGKLGKGSMGVVYKASEALAGLAASQMASSKSTEAVAIYQKLILLSADNAGVRSNLGTA